MQYGRLLFQLETEPRRNIRELESLLRKLNNAVFAVVFNETCLKENLLPIYTNINPHDRAVRHEEPTLAYRKTLVQRQLDIKKTTVESLKRQVTEAKARWEGATVDPALRLQIDTELHGMITQHYNDAENKITRKLNRLGGSNLKVRRPRDGFINLTDTTLTPAQEEFFNLGLNCHYMSKPRPHHKRMEMELLLEDLQQLERDRKVTLCEDLQQQLVAEAGKRRGSFKNKILTPSQRRLQRSYVKWMGLP